MELIEPIPGSPEPKGEGAGLPVPVAAAPAVSPQQRLAELLGTANEHEAAGRFIEAEAVLGQILAIAPDFPAALHLAGIVAFRQGRSAEAVEKIERSIALNPQAPLFQRNACEVYRRVGRYDDALAAGRRSIELDPNDSRALVNLSVLHYHRLELDDAIACAERALNLDRDLPGAHFGIAEASLLRGDLQRGWEEYEWRFRLAGARPLMPASERPQWDGRRLGSGATLLLICDQGYGDVIQFARYIPWAAKRCSNVAVACSRELQPVILQQKGVAQVFDRWEDMPEFAAYCPLSGLPRLAATRVETITAPIPYLRADDAAVAAWSQRLATLLPKGWRRIGLAWAGRASHPNDDVRSIPVETLAPLANLPGIAFVSLQKAPGQSQIGRYWGRAPLINLGPEIADFGDTMAVLEGLELVVTVDTSIAHLAGAMGKPVWMMLPFAPDWRWLLNRVDSPWYPSLRLFRQSEPRRWAPVIAAVAEELARSQDMG